MTATIHTTTRRQVDEHFARRTTPEHERAMREHLVTCDACRGYYERHLLLERLTPSAPSPRERIGRSLGLRAPPAPSTRRWSWAALSLAGATAVALLVSREPIPNAPEFVARGVLHADAAHADVHVFEVRHDGSAFPLDETMDASSGLAFAYRNPEGARYLLVFGVDELDNVYWYFPSWSDEGDDPRAVAIESTTLLTELPEVVDHGYKGSQLRLFALFADEPWDVRAVESALPVGSCFESELSLPVRGQWSQSVRLGRSGGGP